MKKQPKDKGLVKKAPEQGDYYIICTDLGVKGQVIVLGIATLPGVAQVAVDTYNEGKKNHEQHFWFHLWKQPYEAQIGKLGMADTIRYQLPIEIAAQEAEEWLVGATIEEKLSFGYYAVPYGLYGFDRELYNEVLAHVNNQFKLDLLFDVGMSDHPQRDKLWEKAYQKGHGGGMWEILNEARDLAELFK